MSKVSHRYAKAWFQLVCDENKLEQIHKDVKLIENTIKTSHELNNMLHNPTIKPHTKRDIITEVFKDYIQKHTLRFIQFIIKKKRETHLTDILLQFIHLYEEKNNILNVSLYSSQSLEKQYIEKINTYLNERTKKEIHFTTYVDAKLKGGLKLQIKDTVIDGTILNKLYRLSSVWAS